MADLQLRDPVMIGSTKTRVKEIFADGSVRVKQSFGPLERILMPSDIAKLDYDKRVGLWRLR